MTTHHQTRDAAESPASAREPIDVGTAASKTPRETYRKSDPADPSEQVDRTDQAAVEARDPARPASNRQAIGIKFGIDPENLYEAPDDRESRNRAVRDLD